MSIKHKLYKGAAWNAVSQFGSQSINLIIIVILARILGPKDFGLVGMVSVITSFLGYFTEFGLQPSLIQQKEVDDGDCNTGFWTTIFLSWLIYALIFMGAPLIALFYNDGRLTLIARVLFVNFLFSPIGFVPEALETRKLRYSKIASADLWGSVISGVAGISVAFLGGGVWSLVTQQLVFTSSRGIILTTLTGWRPKLYFSFEKVKKLFGLGGHFTIRNLILYLSENIDYLLVGKLLGPTALGIYTLAFRISKYAFLKMWGIVGKMLIPAFNTFRDDLIRVRKNFIQISALGGFFLIPFFVGLFFGVDTLVPMLVGEKWIGSACIVKIFIVYLVIASISYGDDSLMISINELKKLNIYKLITSFLLLVGGYYATKLFGISGMAGAFTASSLIYILIVKRALLSKIGIRAYSYAKCMRPVMVWAVIFAGAIGSYTVIVFGRVPPLIFLVGEAVMFILVSIPFIVKYKIVNIAARSVSVDNLLSLCRTEEAVKG